MVQKKQLTCCLLISVHDNVKCTTLHIPKVKPKHANIAVLFSTVNLFLKKIKKQIKSHCIHSANSKTVNHNNSLSSN